MEASTPVAWTDLTIQLMEELAEHSIRWNDPEYEQFREEMQNRIAELRAGQGAPQAPASASSVVARVADYQRGTQQMIEASLAEMHDTIRILLSVVEQGHASNDQAGAALDRVANLIQSGRSADDLQSAREQLVKALNEMGAMKGHGATGGSSASGAKTEAKAKVPSATDPATGLPSKEAAEAAARSVPPELEEHMFLVAFFVQRMELVTARFGETFGGQVLFFCAQHIARLMHPEDQLFRWRGPCFLALLRRDVSLVEVRQEVLRACGSRIMFESANNSVLLPINMSVQVFHMEGTPVDELLASVEGFLSNPHARR